MGPKCRGTGVLIRRLDCTRGDVVVGVESGVIEGGGKDHKPGNTVATRSFEKGREMDSSLQAPEGAKPANTWTL